MRVFSWLETQTEMSILPGSESVGLQTKIYTIRSSGSPACWWQILGLVSLYNQESIPYNLWPRHKPPIDLIPWRTLANTPYSSIPHSRPNQLVILCSLAAPRVVCWSGAVSTGVRGAWFQAPSQTHCIQICVLKSSGDSSAQQAWETCQPSLEPPGRNDNIKNSFLVKHLVSPRLSLPGERCWEWGKRPSGKGSRKPGHFPSLRNLQLRRKQGSLNIQMKMPSQYKETQGQRSRARQIRPHHHQGT